MTVGHGKVESSHRLIKRRIDSRASWTAQTCAAQRAAEAMTSPERRRLVDPYAKHFVRHPFLRLLVSCRLVVRIFVGLLELWIPGLQAFNVLRVRFAEDIYKTAVGEGVDQLLLLGGGYDSIGIRFGHFPVTIFEVDVAPTLTDKRAVFERLVSGAGKSRVVWVPCDFERDVLSVQLLANGFDPVRPSVVIWMGVSPYLTRASIAATLADLSMLCGPRSHLVMDYIAADVITGRTRWKGARRGARASALRGEPFRSGFTSTEIKELLADNGFECREQVGVPQLMRRYVPTAGFELSSDDWLTVVAAQRI